MYNPYSSLNQLYGSGFFMSGSLGTSSNMTPRSRCIIMSFSQKNILEAGCRTIRYQLLSQIVLTRFAMQRTIHFIEPL